MDIVEAVSARGTCNRGRTACVIVKDKQILVAGYVGSPKGLPHCDEVGHLMKTVVHEDGHQSQHCVRTVHAEQNALCQAAKRGVSVDGATAYTKMTPCAVCAAMLVNAGIVRIVCGKRYHAGAEDLLREAGVEMVFMDPTVEEYPNQ